MLCEGPVYSCSFDIFTGVYNKPVVIGGERKAQLQVPRRSRPVQTRELAGRQTEEPAGRPRAQATADSGPREAVIFSNSPPEVSIFFHAVIPYNLGCLSIFIYFFDEII